MEMDLDISLPVGSNPLPGIGLISLLEAGLVSSCIFVSSSQDGWVVILQDASHFVMRGSLILMSWMILLASFQIM